ncbi:MAG: hypothetical protein ACI8QS_003340 [Planctomycetota bacterium]|jgi:hypothetical protein
MHVAFTSLAIHGEHTFSSVTQTLLHVLHPEHWAVPVLAITGGLLAVYSVRRGLAEGAKQIPRG